MLNRHISLKQKLMLISLGIATVAMLLSGALMLGAELAALRSSITSDLSIKAEIIGSQCTAAIVFNVRHEAQEIMKSLRADQSIEYAAVYLETGHLFAQYRRGDYPAELLLTEKPGTRSVLTATHLSAYQEIKFLGKTIGSVYIRSDLSKLRELLYRYLVSTIVVLGIALLAAYTLASRLQKTITGPVVDLVEMMHRISRSKDFSLRAAESRRDELGDLARGFNEMLATIQVSDRALEAHRSELERSIQGLKHMTEELQDANRKLKALDQLKSDFISVASHEFRTPLTSIKAFVELLIVKPHMGQDRKMKILRVINAESDRLTRLINELLDLAKIESGTTVWEFAEVSMDDIILSSVNSIMPLAQQKDQRLSTTIEPRLPAVRVDRDRVVQVVTNILSNAVKFTPDSGSIRVAVTLDTGLIPQIRVAVSDTGVGIPKEDLGLIFEKFQRSGDQLTSSIEGTGLGLTIARQIIEVHGGKIWAESDHQSGSTFVFTLPVHQERAV